MQNEHAQGAIELIVTERDSARIALTHRYPGVSVPLPQRIDELLFVIYRLDR